MFILHARTRGSEFRTRRARKRENKLPITYHTAKCMGWIYPLPIVHCTTHRSPTCICLLCQIFLYILKTVGPASFFLVLFLTFIFIPTTSLFFYLPQFSRRITYYECICLMFFSLRFLITIHMKASSNCNPLMLLIYFCNKILVSWIRIVYNN